MDQYAEPPWPQQIFASPEEGKRHCYFVYKRCLDTMLAAILLVVLTPLLLVIVLLIKLDTPGSVLFVQERVGARRCIKDGKTYWGITLFRFYKFRSMFHDADQSIHRAHIEAFVEGSLDGASMVQSSFKLTNDPRVTRVGRFLRATSLDELPQLLNVLKGDMSLVGPRPVPAYEVANYKAHHWERLAILPGITGLWQVKGRSQVPFEEMIRMDIDYIRNQSLWLDLKILVLTIPAVLSQRGAG